LEKPMAMGALVRLYRVLAPSMKSAARPHKHLGGAHAYVISGKLRVRDGVLETTSMSRPVCCMTPPRRWTTPSTYSSVMNR
jgi:hypothetical protein